MIVRRAVFAVLLLLVTSAVFGSIGGTWSGMISGVCAPDSPIQPRSKPFSVNLGLIESGNVVAGSLEVTGPSDPCTSAPSPTETIVIQLSATT